MRRQLAALVLALSLPLPALAGQVVVQPGETLSEIAARAGISTQRLMQLNGLRNADLIVAGQRLTVPGAPSRNAGGNRGASTAGGRITVRQGETLSEISERYGVSVERLMQWNGISDPTRLVAGDTIVVRPAPPRRSSGGGGGGGRAGGTTVTVRPGDTLSEIADRTNVSIERLIQLNRLQNPGQIMAGDKLVISTRPPARTTRAGGSAGARVYVVQPGDTLSTIADDHRVPIERLVSLNKLSDPDELVVGTRLKLTAPPPVPRTAPRTTTRPRPRVTAPTVARTPATRTTAAAGPASTTAATRPTTASSRTATTAAGPTAAGTAAPRVSTATAATTATAGGTGAVAGATPATQATAGPASATSTGAASPGTTSTATADSANTTTTGPASTAAAAGSTAASIASSQASTSRRSGSQGAATTTVATASPRATTSSARTGSRSGSVVADWRTYGPMQVDWASWQTMGGSFVTPVLTSNGQPFYLAINCGARKLNTTGATGQWKTWETPQTEFEQTLVNDLCKLKAS